jgi:hypothetical protein
MSIEQWSVLALVTLLPLLEGLTRLRQARASSSQNGGGSDAVAHAPPVRRGSPLANRNLDSVMRAAEKLAIPAPLPQPASDPGVSLARLRVSQAPLSKGAGSFEAQRRVHRPLRGDAVVQWLRPVHNLRRAIVVATILGPPTQ